MLQHCDSMGVPRSYATVLPILFLSRGIAAKTTELGGVVNTSDRSTMVAQLAKIGASPDQISPASVGAFAEVFSGEMMFVMRSMHLIATLHRSLGGAKADRFRAYAAAAAEGECHTNPRPSGPAAVTAMLGTWTYRCWVAARLGQMELSMRLARAWRWFSAHFWDLGAANPNSGAARFSFTELYAQPVTPAMPVGMSTRTG